MTTLKKLIEQRTQLIKEYEDKLNEFTEYKKSCKDEEKKLNCMILKKKTKFKNKLINTLSDLYPHINFTNPKLIDSIYVFTISNNDLKIIKDDLTKHQARTTKSLCYSFGPNEIGIDLEFNSDLIFLIKKSYHLDNINKDHRFYKLYQVVQKLDNILSIDYDSYYWDD